MSWRIFIAAALAVALTLWTAGAPPAAIVFGIALAALYNYKKQNLERRDPGEPNSRTLPLKGQ